MKTIISSRRDILMQVQGSNIVRLFLPFTSRAKADSCISGLVNKCNLSTAMPFLGVLLGECSTRQVDAMAYVSISSWLNKVDHSVDCTVRYPDWTCRPAPFLAYSQEVPQVRREQGRHPCSLLDPRISLRRHQ